MNYCGLPSSSRERDSVTQGIQVGWAHSLCLLDLPCYLPPADVSGFVFEVFGHVSVGNLG